MPVRHGPTCGAERVLADHAALCASVFVQQAPKIGLDCLVDEAHEAYAVAISAGASRAAAIEAACAFYSRRRSELGAESGATAALTAGLRRVK